MVIDRQKRANLIEMFDILSEAFSHIERLIKDGNPDAAIELLSQCQQSAVVIGTSIEESCGEGTKTVSMLEKLCEDIFNASEQPGNGVGAAVTRLQETIRIFDEELPCKKEIVFLPCSPNLWNGFDYLYRQLASDETCNVAVIPIPWYDKEADGSISGQHAHYDTDGYPEYVTLTSLNSYDFAGIHPDVIYIQNVFDNSNLGSSIHPAFYTAKLKELCNELIYIPPFILDETDIDKPDQAEKLREYLCLPGINNVDKIILQSESMKDAMIKLLAGEENSEYKTKLENMITSACHPRVSAIKELIENTVAEDPHKKVILYCNSIPTMLENSSKLITKIKGSFEIFKQNSDVITLIWRPHPLMLEVADHLRPEISDSFRELIEYFTHEGIGVLDTDPDPAPSIALADAYYGDPGSAMELFKLTKKPIMIENPDVL